MKVSFVAGFGPIVRDVASSRAFWGAGLGIELEEAAPSYWTSDAMDGGPERNRGVRPRRASSARRGC
jgi:hypothetical protein